MAGRRSIVAGLCVLLAACGPRGPDPLDEPLPEPSGRVIAPTGTVIQVRLVTDERGNYFEPSRITARPGDVLRLVLVSGMHNFSIPADRNPGRAGLPGPTPLLQTPGQTLDVPVNLPAGEYAFQCDPHVAFGMVGTLTVQ
jgi:plastocyanin